MRFNYTVERAHLELRITLSFIINIGQRTTKTHSFHFVSSPQPWFCPRQYWYYFRNEEYDDGQCNTLRPGFLLTALRYKNCSVGQHHVKCLHCDCFELFSKPNAFPTTLLRLRINGWEPFFFSDLKIAISISFIRKKERNQNLLSLKSGTCLKTRSHPCELYFGSDDYGLGEVSPSPRSSSSRSSMDHCEYTLHKAESQTL